jgi:methylisocitrate lyase
MTMTSVAQLLDDEQLVYAPGAWDGLSARLIERAGFPAVCSSGYAISASLGMPDAELYTMTENIGAIRRIREGCSLPLIADIDTGYGNAVNVIRTVQQARNAGASAVFMEDQVAPKKEPLWVNQPVPLVPIEEAAGKIRAAKDAADDVLIIARTDAHGEDARRRLAAYLAAGADLLMPVTRSFSSIEEWSQASTELGCGLVSTITAGTWVEREFTREVLLELGVRIALLPNQAVHAAAGAIANALRRLHDGEPATDVTADGMPPKEIPALLGFPEILELQAKYHASQPQLTAIEGGM